VDDTSIAGGLVMEIIKLFDSELKLMEIVWAHEPVSAKQLSILAAGAIGWNKNTTYTIIKKLIDKQAILRADPGFICTTLVKKTAVRKAETDSLIDKLYDGSKQAFFSAFLQDESLSAKDLAELKAMIENR
jgi:BlaI family penicillinase repressor